MELDQTSCVIKAPEHDNDYEDVPIIEVRNGSNKRRFFNCKVCQRKFLKPEVARMHVEVVHMKLYQFQCRFCKKIYKRRSTLWTHFLRLHPSGKSSDILQFRNDEALKYVIDVKTGRTLHETEIKTFSEDIDENVQNGRRHEAVENHRSENEDPNHPFHKGSVQTVDSFSKTDNLAKNIPSSLNSHPGQNEEKTEMDFHHFVAEDLSNDNFDGNDLSDAESNCDNLDSILDASKGFFKLEEEYSQRGHISDEPVPDTNQFPDIVTTMDPVSSANAKSSSTKSSGTKRLPYRCKLCTLDFLKKTAIRSHIDEFHLNIRQYRCLYCGELFLTRPSIASHCKVQHKKPTKMHFEDNQEALEHIEVAEWFKLGERFNCDLCTSHYSRFDKLKTHCKERHGTEAPVLTKPLPEKFSSKFTCKFCNHKIKTLDRAMRHVEINHLFFYKFNCGVCEKVFKRKARLKEHCHKAHPNERVKLIIKSSNFALQYLNTHSSDRKKVFQCPECQLHFPVQSALTKHVRVFHEEKSEEVLEKMLEVTKATFSCSKCNTGFKNERTLLQHQMRKIPCDQMPVKVSTPEIKFDTELVENSYQKLDESNPRFTGNYQYACLLCSVRCKTDKAIRLHITSIHMSDPNISCKLCPLLKFRSKHGLWYHHRQVHAEKMTATCDKCGVSCTNNKTLMDHMRMHETEYKYKCDICDKAYRRKDGLYKHKQWAHGDTISQKVTCEICGSVVKGKSYLKKHIRQVHGNERRFECHICPMKFVVKQDLQKHIKVVHEKIKEIKCDYCDKMFANNVAKKRHMTNIHWKLKNHECTACHRMFAARDAMVSHMMTIHGINARIRTVTRFKPEASQPTDYPDKVGPVMTS